MEEFAVANFLLQGGMQNHSVMHFMNIMQSSGRQQQGPLVWLSRKSLKVNVLYGSGSGINVSVKRYVETITFKFFLELTKIHHTQESQNFSEFFLSSFSVYLTLNL